MGGVLFAPPYKKEIFMAEYIWFKNSNNTRSIHKRNKKTRKSKLDQLKKDGWVQIKSETDRTPVKISKPKPKAKKKSKDK